MSMKPHRILFALTVPAVLLAAGLTVQNGARGAQADPGGNPMDRRPALRAHFMPAATPPRSALSRLVPIPPTFAGKRWAAGGRAGSPAAHDAGTPGGPAGPSSGIADAAAPAVIGPDAATPVVTAGPDVFVVDGSETALAVDLADGNRLAAMINQGYLNSASIAHSTDGNLYWFPATFPNGSGTFTGPAFDPWGSPGNAANELYASLIRFDNKVGSSLTRMIVARSTDAGSTWSRRFEVVKSNIIQDRDMFDVDRSAAHGGGSGTAHDGKLYLTFDGFNTAGAFVASYFQVISATGAALTELKTSLPMTGGFLGTMMQPVAGISDGQVYLMSVAITDGGATTYLAFHEVTGAGTAFAGLKSYFGFPTGGQQLGSSGRWGVNGHRAGTQMQMDIDRSSGARRGALYVVSIRNPNPGDAAQDQGDVWLSVSTDGAQSWSEAPLPGQASGKTTFFGMIDVDDDGWIHVAYYQNETGSTNGGVLNAATANLYYTVSSDGGTTWAAPTRVNGDADTLQYFDPPPDLSGQEYYLIGDYAQVRAASQSGTKVAYVFWSGYDKSRDDLHFAQKRDRGICTTMTPTIDSDGDGLLDPADNCPTIYNPSQTDADSNGVGDLCQCLLNRANVDNTGASLNRIDGSDLFPLARAFGSCSGDAAYNAAVDLNAEGCVDGYDLALLAGIWAEPVPLSCP